MIAVDTTGTCLHRISARAHLCLYRLYVPTVSLSRSKIFILDEEPEVEGSPADTILEMYPDTAATTSMMNRVSQSRNQ